jgi:2-keto-4-pentenoate hydratase/2-oxohepta-3-ene-1,7-dioic acid hydratase in catechol pathway
MKIARFRVENRVRYGVVEGDRVREIRGSIFGRFRVTDVTYPLGQVKLLPPTTPIQVFGLGANYESHRVQAETTSGRPWRGGVLPFLKGIACLTGHEDPIIHTKEAREVHYEGELVIVIGKRARRVSKEEALRYVLGYCCGNDVSEKGSWEADPALWRAKCVESWGPVGPWIATDVDPRNLDVTIRLNGQVEHKFNTRDMLNDVPTIVSEMSQYITLYPGDLIFTGTSGITRPMKPGDVVEVEIEGIGTLRNPIVAEE